MAIVSELKSIPPFYRVVCRLHRNALQIVINFKVHQRLMYSSTNEIFKSLNEKPIKNSRSKRARIGIKNDAVPDTIKSIPNF